jgi:hypothetical protein
VTISESKSNIVPICPSWPRIRSMFDIVHLYGWIPLSMAAFSAGSPKASKPIGKKTLYPRIRIKRARVSDGVIAYQ